MPLLRHVQCRAGSVAPCVTRARSTGSEHAPRRFADIVGAVISLVDGRVLLSTDGTQLILLVDRFNYIGGEGAAPRQYHRPMDVNEDQVVQRMIMQFRVCVAVAQAARGPSLHASRSTGYLRWRSCGV